MRVSLSGHSGGGSGRGAWPSRSHLDAAYVDARYSFTFEVSREDLEALAWYVGSFKERAERACQERLAELAVAPHALAGRNR
jgi:hypothetical protein